MIEPEASLVDAGRVVDEYLAHIFFRRFAEWVAVAVVDVDVSVGRTPGTVDGDVLHAGWV